MGDRMRSSKLFLLIACLTLAACTSPNNCNQSNFSSKFDCQMNKAKKFCLDQGFIGHEPEYRSCVIRKSTQIINSGSYSSIKSY